jgi:hypothetical protein
MKVVEMQDIDYGYRFWSEPMPESEVEGYIAHFESIGYEVSDVDDAAQYDEDDWEDPTGLTDVEADAATLASAGWGTDEDYGYFGDDFGGEW